MDVSVATQNSDDEKKHDEYSPKKEALFDGTRPIHQEPFAENKSEQDNPYPGDNGIKNLKNACATWDIQNPEKRGKGISRLPGIWDEKLIADDDYRA
jgi:hypothetical protein